MTRREAAGVERDAVGARALREWITGSREQYARVFLVESGASARSLNTVAGKGDVVLLPADSEPYAGPATAVHYGGALHDVGDELFFGERGVELQDYVAADYVQIVGPTAVCFFDMSSWRAFLDDAELARRTGVFPSALIDPRLLFANRAALADPGAIEAPSAIRVSPDGSASIGVRGPVIGHVDDLHRLLTVPLPHVAVWEDIAPREVFLADLASRRWIGRYLNATDLMKMLRLANGAAKIAGFGWSLIDDALDDAEPRTSDPFLLETTEGFLLADPTTLRRQLLSPLTAMVVAVVQTSSAPQLAAERVARQLGIPVPEAGSLCGEALAALGIHLGRRAASVRRTTGVDA